MRKSIILFIVLFFLFSLKCGKKNIISGTNIIEIESDWSRVELPSIEGDWAIQDIEFTNPNKGWAVGTKGFDDVLPERGIILKYDGSVWTEMDLPSISSNWTLWSISMISGFEGWAVGGDLSRQDTVVAVILHYDGSSWNKVYPDYNGENFPGILVSVSFGASNEGWAVGNAYIFNGIIPVKTGILLLYKDEKWTIVSSPVYNGLNYDCGYYNICFNTKTDGWLSGYDDSFSVQAELYHFRTDRWVFETSLAAGDYYHIQRIVYDNNGGVWGVGQDQLMIGNLPPAGLVIQYTPDGWMALPKFSNPKFPVEFYGIAVIDENNIWIGGGNQYMYLLWFNDNKWHQVKLKEEKGAIRDIVFTSDSEGWAAGVDYTDGYRNGKGIIYHYKKEK